MALNDIPSKRFKPKAPAVKKFDWTADPADRLRGKGDAITGDQSKSMLAFNRNLTEPLDRGGGSAIRINGAPVSLAGTGTQSIGRQQPWQQTTSAQAAAIAARYSAPPNPNLISPTPVTPPATTVAPTAAAGPVGSPGETALNDPNSVNPSVPENPSTGAPINPVDNPNLNGAKTGAGTDIAPPSSGLGVLGQAPVLPNAPGASGGVGELTNPNTGAPVARTAQDDAAQQKQRFLAEGGSEASYHRAQVAAGIRPAIDARATQNPNNSTASAEVAAAHGFGPTPQATAQNVAGQMTEDFNANNAKSQAAWNQRVSDARQKLMDSLNNN